MRILILGGDGFCGWPTSLHLSACGHEVDIVDNLARRAADVELGGRAADADPAARGAPGPPGARWRGREIAHHRIDVAKEYELLRDLLAERRPDAIVHFAEQRAAPYSMKSPRHKRYTVDNNVNATHNLLAALVETELDAHVVHLGTMGVYGYGGRAEHPRGLPRGCAWRTPRVVRSSRRSCSPPNPGSVYHMTKTMDQLALRLLREERRRPRHRPAPGHRLGHPDRRDPPRRPAHQPVRLRRRLRHGPQPLPDAGRDRLPADRARDGRPDPRVHPHPGHRALHPARHREPAGARRPRADLQPGDRGAPHHRPGRARVPDDRRRRSTWSTTRARRPRRTTWSSRTAACWSSAWTRSRSRTTCCTRSSTSPCATATAATSTRSPCRSRWTKRPDFGMAATNGSTPAPAPA